MKSLPRVPLLAATIIAFSSAIASGQAQSRDFDRPFVVLDTGGHSAPVRSLIFAPDGTRLLSGGFDKAIPVWDVADGRGAITRTIRPPIWRGRAGIIYAMALSPGPGADGSRLLAVAGSGVANTRGEILLFRDPGGPARPDGDLSGLIPAYAPEFPGKIGHSHLVMALAFSPSGDVLASCGMDGRLILWDIARKSAIASLSGPGRPLNALAFRPDGKVIATGGADGRIRLWDVEKRSMIAEELAIGGAHPAGMEILCLAYRPAAASTLVAGRENGRVTRYEGSSLRGATRLPEAAPSHGPVEAMAFSHDGRTLAVSVVSHPLVAPADRPRVDCEVRLHAMPDGTPFPRKFPANNLIQALAFSPDDRRIALSGGDDRAIEIHDLADPARPAMRLRGQGSSVWRVGFGKEREVIGFSHAQDPSPASEYLGFDLKGLAISPITPSALSRAERSWKGWEVTAVDPWKLSIRGPGGKVISVALDPLVDRRWWDFGFLPPGPGHDKLCLGVACDAGVVIVRAEDGVRTRVLAGHTAEVYSLAPSPDNRLLITGSSDQTVRLWSLSGCDSLPPLGATFRNLANGEVSALSVAPVGFAEAMGLKVGDVVEVLAIDGVKKDRVEDLEAIDRLAPGTRVEFLIRRGDARFPLGTTRRDSPRVSLFVGEDREWVAWTPQGYYETSVAGDRKYLGWHRNGPTAEAPTDRFPADRFEKEFRRPAVLSAMVANDDPTRALALVVNPAEDPSAIVRAQAPPTVTLTVPAAPVAAPAADRLVAAPPGGLVVRARVAAEGRSPIATLRVLVDGLPAVAPIVFDPPRDAADESVPVPLHPGRQQVSVIAVNRDGKERIEALEVVLATLPPRRPTLHVVTIGTDGPFADGRLPSIPFAEADARDLRSFLSAPGGKTRYEGLADEPSLIGKDDTGRSVRETFRHLGETVVDPNDALVVLLESHVLIGAKERFVIASDTSAHPASADTPSAEEIGEALAKVAARGTKVLLLLDTSHEKAPAECRSGLSEFVRSLSRRNVIVFVAANHGASRRVIPRGHGAFAQAILECFDARASSRPLVARDRPMSLDDFQDAVVSRVKELTGRRQFAACYVPETLSPRMAIFEPNAMQNLAGGK